MAPATVITILSEARLLSGQAARGLWVMWLTLTALAAVAAAPAIHSLARHFGHSRAASRLAVELDPAAIAEWVLRTGGDALATTLAAIAAALLVVLPLSVFWAGGALGQLAHKGGFFENAARYFWRLLRLAVFSGLFYAALFAAYASASRGVSALLEDSMEAWPLVMARQGLMVMLAAAAAVLAAGFDYAKARMVAGDSESAVSAGFAGLGFVLRHPWRALAPLAFIALCGALLFAFYQTAYNVFDYRGLRTILISIAGQQLYLLLRLWLRLWHWSACLRVDHAWRRPAAPWTPAAPEPHGDNI